MSHADVWKKIGAWVDKFAAAVDVGLRTFETVHVKAHSGIAGNERTDKLAGMGSKLRHDLMVKSHPRGWFRNMVERYVNNRI